jgi:hypothetical protein
MSDINRVEMWDRVRTDYGTGTVAGITRSLSTFGPDMIGVEYDSEPCTIRWMPVDRVAVLLAKADEATPEEIARRIKRDANNAAAAARRARPEGSADASPYDE